MIVPQAESTLELLNATPRRAATFSTALGIDRVDQHEGPALAQQDQSLRESIPPGRFQTAAGIARAAWFLCSDDITGQSVVVDGRILA